MVVRYAVELQILFGDQEFDAIRALLRKHGIEVPPKRSIRAGPTERTP